MSEIARKFISEADTLRRGAELMNSGVGGIILVLDEDGCMIGTLTDGDLRRAVLAGADLDDPIGPHANRKFTFATAGESRQQMLSKLNDVIRHLPVLKDGRPVDLLSWKDLWWLPVAEPNLAGNELKYVADCVNTSWISSQGSYVVQFEKMFADFVAVEHALTTSSGTTALQLAMAALGIGPGDEVIVPAVTFGATANAAIQVNARPVFVDVDAVGCLCPEAFADAVTERTKAVVPVHLFGHACDMDRIGSIAKERGILVIEDCAEALGAHWNGRPVGSFGDAAAFSFFANKIITTGEGGMVVCPDPELADRMRLLRDHGMQRDRRYWHLEPGFNFRMTNIQAAIGVAQMEQVDTFLAHRRALASVYENALRDVPGVELPQGHAGSESVPWLFLILVDASTRDRLITALKAVGVDTRAVFPSLHVQPAFGSEVPGRLPTAELFSDRGLCLPLSNRMTVAEVERTVSSLRDELKKMSET
ncbi:aminotransferase class V-fold PLP-dependent enzyme [Roseibium sp. HPY-6]|uniref:aminotransferase class V-fold PLP-dependent enzyme n=1 Tax=Roseibium sp. HPY-6 TaxID=3229852 RepID=UPI00338FD00B